MPVPGPRAIESTPRPTGYSPHATLQHEGSGRCARPRARRSGSGVAPRRFSGQQCSTMRPLCSARVPSIATVITLERGRPLSESAGRSSGFVSESRGPGGKSASRRPALEEGTAAGAEGHRTARPHCAVAAVASLALLTGTHPAHERVFGPKVPHPAVLEISRASAARLELVKPAAASCSRSPRTRPARAGRAPTSPHWMRRLSTFQAPRLPTPCYPGSRRAGNVAGAAESSTRTTVPRVPTLTRHRSEDRRPHPPRNRRRLGVQTSAPSRPTSDPAPVSTTSTPEPATASSNARSPSHLRSPVQPSLGSPALVEGVARGLLGQVGVEVVGGGPASGDTVSLGNRCPLGVPGGVTAWSRCGSRLDHAAARHITGQPSETSVPNASEWISMGHEGSH